jgi:pantetheine-phosphate adenylyltransferase
MKKIGIYPGSFNPFHAGHRDVLEKARLVFDHIYIYLMKNPEKEYEPFVNAAVLASRLAHLPNVSVNYSTKPLINVVRELKDKESSFAIIRGLRNGHDLQYEMNNQYWNEDVGIEIPFVYFITDRSLAHVSSSAIRSLDKLGLKHEY